MEKISNQVFDQERALYGKSGLQLYSCRFDGPADGESALKECQNIQAYDTYFNLRYPFWHDHGLVLNRCELTEGCRAALWYSEDIRIENSKLHGIKALRECRNVTMEDCDVVSPEFGWFTNHLNMHNCSVQGEYFLLRCSDVTLKKLHLKGKYSLQYLRNAVLENCILDTKDAFWHADNVVVRNCVVRGEYLAWYSNNVTFIDCKIIGTQPLCYCTGLKLINCEMEETDLAFEKSEVEATLVSDVVSIKNPLNGYILAPSVGQIIRDDPNSIGAVLVGPFEDALKAETILKGGYTCALCRGASVRTSRLRGVKPLVQLLQSGEDLRRFCAADRVVGKATAFLYQLLGVKSVFAQVISKPAVSVLQAAGITVNYNSMVDHIVNRTGDGICPFEATVMEIDNAGEAYDKILEKMCEMHISP